MNKRYVGTGGGAVAQVPGTKATEKLSMFQKILLVRWINSNEVWHTELRVDSLLEDLKTGVLLCNILKFHMPNLDFSGLNTAGRAKKPCLNNIEKALQVMY